MQLTVDELSEKSMQIARHLYNWEVYQKAETIHTYVSSQSKHEIDTFHIIESAIASGKRVAVPKMAGQSKLKHYRLPSTDYLKPNKWGIPEPDGTPELDVSQLDLILVPMAVTDKNLNRIGYGKGYYDRFLEGSEAIKAGLILDRLIHCEILPADKHDIPMDFVISESGIIVR